MDKENMTSEDLPRELDIQEILTILPHRAPFLLVDKVLDYKEFDWIKTIKNITYNEHFFPGHFPKKAVFPGVLIIEAMAQSTGILGYKSWSDTPNSDTIYYFASVDNAKFKRPVVPGDILTITATFLKEKRGMAKFSCVAKVNEKIVCSADIMCARREV